MDAAYHWLLRALTVALLAPSLALAQQGPVKQTGNVTPGHVAAWATNGLVKDGGTAADGALTSLGVTTSGPGICQNSGPLSGPYNQLCLSVTKLGGGQISLYNYNGATGGLSLNLNGAVQGLPTIGLPTTTNSYVCFLNTSGQLGACSPPLYTAILAGGATASSTLTLESTTGAGTTDYISFKTASQVEAWRIDTKGDLWSDPANVYNHTYPPVFGAGGTPPQFLAVRKLTTAQTIVPISYIDGQAPGDALTSKGIMGQGIFLYDPAGTVAGTRGNLWGQFISIAPIVDRNLGNGTEDANGLMIKNDGTATATSAIYISDSGAMPGFGWDALMEIHNNTNNGISFQDGEGNRGIDMSRLGTNVYDDVAIRTTSLRIDGGGNTSMQDDSVAAEKPAFQSNSISSSPTIALWMNAVWRNSASAAGYLEFGHSRGATAGTQTILQSGDQTGNIDFMGSDGAQFQDSVYIRGTIDSAPAAGSMPGQLSFWTSAAGSVSPTKRVQIDSSGHLYSLGGGIGYGPSGAGAGSTVSQGTSRTTAVSINKSTGQITMFSAAGSATPATFTVNNTAVAATDTILLNQQSGTNLYELFVTAVAGNSFNVTFFTTGGTATDAPVINFTVIKGQID